VEESTLCRVGRGISLSMDGHTMSCFRSAFFTHYPRGVAQRFRNRCAARVAHGLLRERQTVGVELPTPAKTGSELAPCAKDLALLPAWFLGL
jgi:hypothetical protein